MTNVLDMSIDEFCQWRNERMAAVTGGRHVERMVGIATDSESMSVYYQANEQWESRMAKHSTDRMLKALLKEDAVRPLMDGTYATPYGRLPFDPIKLLDPTYDRANDTPDEFDGWDASVRERVLFLKLDGPVTQGAYAHVRDVLAHYDGDFDSIRFTIRTPGGMAAEACMIAQKLQEHTAPVTTHALEECSSAGIELLLSGTTRIVDADCECIVHLPQIVGDRDYSSEEQHGLIREAMRIAEYLADHSRYDAQYWLGHLEDGQALRVEYLQHSGLATHVTSRAQEEAELKAWCYQ